MEVEGVIRLTTNESVPTRESTLYEDAFSLDESTVVTAKFFNDNGESSKVIAQLIKE